MPWWLCKNASLVSSIINYLIMSNFHFAFFFQYLGKGTLFFYAICYSNNRINLFKPNLFLINTWYLDIFPFSRILNSLFIQRFFFFKSYNYRSFYIDFMNHFLSLQKYNWCRIEKYSPAPIPYHLTLLQWKITNEARSVINIVCRVKINVNKERSFLKLCHRLAANCVQCYFKWWHGQR